MPTHLPGILVVGQHHGLLLKPLWSGCDGKVLHQRFCLLSFTFSGSKQDRSAPYPACWSAWAREWFSSVSPFNFRGCLVSNFTASFGCQGMGELWFVMWNSTACFGICLRERPLHQQLPLCLQWHLGIWICLLSKLQSQKRWPRSSSPKTPSCLCMAPGPSSSRVLLVIHRKPAFSAAVAVLECQWCFFPVCPV